MDADDGVLGGERAHLRGLQDVHGGQPVEHLAEGLGERLVREVLVAPHRVAAGRRAVHEVQDRGDRRVGPEGDVDVPLVGLAALVGLDEGDLGVGLQLRQEGVHLDLAEAAAECDVRVGREVRLARDEQHEVLHQQLVEKRIAELRDAITTGGIRECMVRAALYVGMARGSVDELR